MPGVELSTSARAGHVVVALRGELDVTGAADAEAAVTALVAPGRSLIINLSALDFIDCSSLSALLRVQRLAQCAGGDVILAAPQRQALRLLALTGKDDAFALHVSVEGAVVSIGSRQTRYGGRGLAVSAARPGRVAPSRTCTG
jgi:anti-sigma B factor antagonist